MYPAVQNQMVKLRAGGRADEYQPDDDMEPLEKEPSDAVMVTITIRPAGEDADLLNSGSATWGNTKQPPEIRKTFRFQGVENLIFNHFSRRGNHGININGR